MYENSLLWVITLFLKELQRAHRGIAATAAVAVNQTGILRQGGGGGIRTHETLSGLTVFKTAAFNRSATPPKLSPYCIVA